MSDHNEHHHEETFISKYIFSTDHKMIAKQFLITAMVMGVIAILMSVFLLCLYISLMFLMTICRAGTTDRWTERQRLMIG